VANMSVRLSEKTSPACGNVGLSIAECKGTLPVKNEENRTLGAAPPPTRHIVHPSNRKEPTQTFLPLNTLTLSKGCS